MMPEDPNIPMYWQELIVELMQHIPLVPLVDDPKEDKLADRVARHNCKTYGGSYNPMDLKEWIGGMKNIFTVIEVIEEKRVNIEMFYLTREGYI